MGVTYNLKRDLPVSSFHEPHDEASEEFDSPETIEAIRRVLEDMGHEVYLLGGDLGVIEKIKEHKIEFVFNLAEGFQGRSREAHIPAVLELLGIPYSGSDPLALALTLDKALTKRVALSCSVPTPEFWILVEPNDLKLVPERFPLFVKPAWQGSSKGIRFSSKVQNRAELKQEAGRLFRDYPNEPVLVEAYIPGREFTVGVLGGSRPEILGIMEIAFRDKNAQDFFYSLEVKRDWKRLVEYRYPVSLGAVIEKGIADASLQLFKVLGLRDTARFDFRVSPEGLFTFLEVNPLPGLSPESGDLVILALKRGLSYSELINRILQSALERSFSRAGKSS